MANWASVSYAIEGPAETLKKIEEAIKHPVKEEGASPNWEGGVLLALGISIEEIDKACTRGFIQDVEPYMVGNALRFETEEAWGLQDFNELLEKHFTDIKVYWVVEELGCEVYCTNDKEGKYFPERYWVDTCIDGGYESEYFETEEQALNWLADLTSGEVSTMNDVDEFNNRAERQCKDEDNFIHIHKFDIEE